MIWLITNGGKCGMYKKMVFFIILLCCMIILACGYTEELITYDIPEISVSISVPDGWYKADRCLKDGDPACEVLGLSGEEFINKYLTDDLFFLAFDDEVNYLLEIRSWNTTKNDFLSISDEEILGICKNNLTDYFDEYNTFVTETIHYNEVFFLQILEKKNGESALYYGETVKNGKYYDIFLSCFSGGYKYEDKILIEEIMKSFSITIFNESKTTDANGWRMVYLPEKQISIAIPESYEVITLQTTESSFFDIDEITAVKDTMTQTGNYLDAILPDFSREITVNISDNIFPSLGWLSEDLFNSFVSQLEEGYRNAGASLINYESIKDGNIRYLKTRLKFGTDDIASFALQYGTIIDSQTIWITLLSYDGEPTQDDALLLEQIWGKSDLLKHEYSEINPEDTEASSVNYYIDQSCGFRVVIPNGWEQIPLSKERQFVKMKMSPGGKSDDACILYGQADVYGMLSDGQKKLWNIKSRKDVDGLFDTGVAEEMLGEEITAVTEKEINGIRYYIGTIMQKKDVITDVLQVETEETVAVFIKDGYFVYFQFYDMSNNNKYQETFDMVLNSFSFQ